MSAISDLYSQSLRVVGRGRGDYKSVVCVGVL